MLRGPASNVGEYNSTLGNTGYAPGAMTSTTTPNPWQPYFGEPVREFKGNPYAAYGRENNALPDAYQGSIPYMTQLMIHIIKDEDLWPTKVVCPVRITESEMEVAWDEIVFNDHMLAPVPEEGISRLVTQQTNERRDHYVRYGIALILEHGFMVRSCARRPPSADANRTENGKGAAGVPDEHFADSQCDAGDDVLWRD
jgi:hypothetical protein